jgi:hypothetical protein
MWDRLKPAPPGKPRANRKSKDWPDEENENKTEEQQESETFLAMKIPPA